MSWTAVLFPQPLFPTRATVCPLWTVRFRPFKICEGKERKRTHFTNKTLKGELFDLILNLKKKYEVREYNHQRKKQYKYQNIRDFRFFKMIKQWIWVRSSYKYNLQYLDISSSWIRKMNIIELQIPFDVVWFVSSLWKTVNFRILNKTKFNDYSITEQTIAFLRNMIQQIPKIRPGMT